MKIEWDLVRAYMIIPFMAAVGIIEEYFQGLAFALSCILGFFSSWLFIVIMGYGTILLFKRKCRHNRS